MPFLSYILSYPFSSVASFLPSFLVAFFLIWFVSFLPSFLHSFLHFFIPPSSSFHLFDSLMNFDQPPYLPCVAHKPPRILCVSIRCHELHQAAAELARGRRNDPVTRMVEVEFLELQWQTEAGALWKPGTNGTLAALAARRISNFDA